MKSDAEILAAVEALKAWFISQELAPSEAGACLIKLTAQQLVGNMTKIEDLSMAITLFHNQLTMEVARYVEERNELAKGKLQ